LPDLLGISGYYNKRVAIALEKSKLIDDSLYKYLVAAGQFLLEEGSRGKFIDNVTSLRNEISDKPYSIYGTIAENNAYKQSLIGYIERI
jgi:hypothetical protein